MFLKEDSFAGLHIVSTREVPLISLIFGGSCGAYLSNLVALSAWIAVKERLMGLQFEYRSPGNKQRVENFGFCESISLK